MKMIKIFLFLFLAGVASTSRAENIIPPEGKSSQSEIQDQWSCVNAAMRTASGDGELLKGLDKELLLGHSTVGHLFEQLLSDPLPIVPKENGVLAPRESLFNGLRSTKLTDPYVVCLLLKGYRWESSKESGLEMLQRMADQGNARAQVELGRAYYFGTWVNINNSLAFKLFSAAASANDQDGLFYLAILYSEGDGTLPNDDMAIQLLKKAAYSGHPQAQHVLPQAEQKAANRKKKNDEATLKLEKVRAAAESGDLEAQRTLAYYFIEGLGVAQDANSAIEWYRKAAQAGDVIAARELGILYDKGRGVSVDFVEAIKWYKVAAEQDDARAQYNLGIFLYYGYGTEKNEELGKDWIRRAADQNNQMAIRALRSLK